MERMTGSADARGLTVKEPAATGLTDEQAAAVRAEVGPNAVRSHRARPVAVLARQLRSPLLILLLVAATVSFFVGERTDAVVIGVIVALSVGLGFANEYRAERGGGAARAHAQPGARAARRHPRRA
ncbi:cation-transporting P-type ATPase [Microbispora rosea]|uniref:cation-transporting P-type ATPase n=1 Tax=Microbispora rosea TaxID=58117 RepID=UPI00379945D3